jgi:hypothetical protein
MPEEKVPPAERYGPWSHDEVIDSLLSGLNDDYLGLWQIPKLLADADVTTVAERRSIGLRLVRDLVLTHRLIPGFLGDNGGFDPWPLEPDEAVRRIESEWNAMSHDPNISDICWFNKLGRRTASST